MDFYLYIVSVNVNSIMELPLLITTKRDGHDIEFKHSVEVSEEEYDFLMRVEKAEAGLHVHPWFFLHEHAPLLEERIEWDCVDAVKAKYGEVFSTRWRGVRHKDFYPSFPSDEKRNREDLQTDSECELLMVPVGGVMITDENIIGCHACRYYEYDTSPRDASGFYLKDRDIMDYDVFGRNTVSVNERADHARYFRGGYVLIEKTLSVDYFDENNNYQQVTQTWKYEGSGLCVDGPHSDKSIAIFGAIRRSLLAISKKRLTDKRDELRNRAAKFA